MDGIERRTFELDQIEVRAASADAPALIKGHAAVFDTLSEEMFGMREKIRPGAFQRSLKKADVRALFNHDPNIVLGRNKSGTLELREDDKGLWFQVEPPDTQAARDLLVSINRGDISQASFSFMTVKDQWTQEGDMTIRELIDVELFDVSPVTFPAYTKTDVKARSWEQCAAGLADERRQAASAERGQWAAISAARRRRQLEELALG